MIQIYSPTRRNVGGKMTRGFSPEETPVILGRSMRSCYSSAIYAWLLEIIF